MHCFVCRLFCTVHGLKRPLHHYNWLSFGKFQDTKRFLIPCPRHVLSQLPPSGETCKYATVPSTQKKTWRDSLPIDMLLSVVSVLVVAQPSSEFPEGRLNYPVHRLSRKYPSILNISKTNPIALKLLGIWLEETLPCIHEQSPYHGPSQSAVRRRRLNLVYCVTVTAYGKDG
jgi:hypothetical protein